MEHLGEKAASVQTIQGTSGEFSECSTCDHKTFCNDTFVICLLQVFLQTAEQRDAWIGTQEAYLANEDLGVSGFTARNNNTARSHFIAVHRNCFLICVCICVLLGFSE